MARVFHSRRLKHADERGLQMRTYVCIRFGVDREE